MIILGAGLSGALAAVMNHDATVVEAKDESSFLLSPEHKAVLRFRSDKISRITNIPFKQVQVRKSIWYQGNEYRLPDIRFTNMYSRKVSGGYYDRSIVNLDTVTRWIAPEDFHLRLLKRIRNRVKFSLPVTGITEFGVFSNLSNISPFPDKLRLPVISTLPMPVIGRIVGEESPVSFEKSSRKIEVWRYRISNCDLNVSMYYPDPDISLYRASVMGSLLSIEMISHDRFYNGNPTSSNSILEEVLRSLGVHKGDIEYIDSGMQPGKLNYRVDETARKNFILKLTMQHKIYSLGRFAIWKNILQDDVYEDILKISGLIGSGTNYDLMKESAAHA